jgi:hypothetical protein
MASLFGGMTDADELMADEQVVSVLRDQAFDEIGRLAALSESYSRSLAEAAYRGDQTTVLMHARHLRLCCVALIKTYKDYLEAKPNGQDMAAGDGSPQPDRADQRSGNGMARGQPQ